MKHYESVIIGHITKDFNIDHEGKQMELCGGAVLFSSASAFSLGHKVLAVTKLNEKDRDRLSQFTLPEEDIYCVPCDSSSTMRNQYFTPDKEKRDSTCLSVGTPFSTDDIPSDIESDIYHFAGLVYGDFPDEMIKECAKRGKVAVDVQACLRHVDRETGKMFFLDWENKKEMLPFITYLKTDAAEAEILTGTSDRAEAARILHSMGAKEKLQKLYNREPTTDEIAAELGIPVRQVVLALESIVTPMSLYEPVYNDNGDELYVVDQLGDSHSEDNWIGEISIKEAIRNLDDREKLILKKRFSEGKTQTEVAQELSISQAQVSRIEKNARKKIKEECIGQHLPEYTFLRCFV